MAEKQLQLSVDFLHLHLPYKGMYLLHIFFNPPLLVKRIIQSEVLWYLKEIIFSIVEWILFINRANV